MPGKAQLSFIRTPDIAEPRASAYLRGEMNSKNSDDTTKPVSTSDGLTPSPLVAVERAANDLRAGLPAIIHDGGAGALVFAAEFTNAEKLATLTRWSGAVPDLALTHNRAATLKIRLYTPGIVLVPITGHVTLEVVGSLADPELDLARPLRGPFDAKRDAIAPANFAAVQLAKVARLLPAVVTVPLPSGAPNSEFAAVRDQLCSVDANTIMSYDTEAAMRLERVTAARVPLAGAENARIIAFRRTDGGSEHLAIVIGNPTAPVLARLHSECFTGDLLGSLKCDCGQQLRGAIDQIAAEGAGVLLYLAQEGRGIGLINKLRAYALQDQGFDTMEANVRLGFEADERVFLPAAEMLRLLGFASVRLMTNNPDKVAALETFGIEVAERVPHAFPTNEHNAFYLSTKADKGGHLL
jgi:GTP cyclohydrolase II